MTSNRVWGWVLLLTGAVLNFCLLVLLVAVSVRPVPPEIYYGNPIKILLPFLVPGFLMIAGGWWLLRRHRNST